ncbi:hypothetical protein [Methylobacterium variabile]|jgi:hypothetical protein|uniref:hypothetical protein n=1 Tax=Methylobacterium variabile TaxID=298794 RepID=UPI0012EE0B7B|nr:hypothetical protein [Methylobacterium variabile]
MNYLNGTSKLEKNAFIFNVGNQDKDEWIAADDRQEAIVQFLRSIDIEIDRNLPIDDVREKYGLSVDEIEMVVPRLPIRMYEHYEPVVLGSVDVLVTDGCYALLEDDQPGSWRVVLRNYRQGEELTKTFDRGLHIADEKAWAEVCADCIERRFPSREDAIAAAEHYAAAVRAMSNMEVGSHLGGLIFVG